MPNEREVRALARNALRTARLPRGDPDRTWSGNGVGMPCAVCGEVITGDQVEYEVQFRHGAAPRMDRFHLHLRCFAAWEMERTKP